jgi:CRP/FNR family transcriptional activator FtrB
MDPLSQSPDFDSTFKDLRALDLFRDMQDSSFELLMQGAYLQTFPPQVELITEGEQSDFLHVVVAGSVELYARWNARETSMATVRPTSTFILAATIRNAPNLMSARTVEKSRIVLIPSTDIRKVFDLDGGFARAIVQELAHCYRAVIKNTKDLKFRTAIERLANFLLREQHRNQGAARFDLPFDKKRLASLLAMRPENLSRAFKQLQQYGVHTSGPLVEIGNQQDLEMLAKPDVLIDDPRS